MGCNLHCPETGLGADPSGACGNSCHIQHVWSENYRELGCAPLVDLCKTWSLVNLKVIMLLLLVLLIILSASV